MNCKQNVNCFAPATSKVPPEESIVLPAKFLSLSETGSLGIFLFPSDIQYINQPPHDLANIRGKLFPENRTVHYSFCPALKITVVPMDFGDNKEYGIEVGNINYFLQHPMGRKRFPGYRATVKLDFMIWHAQRWARKFQIDGAVLLDPKFKHLLVNPDAPVCFLGMDFMIKYPHLLFEPEYDSHHDLEFRLAEGPFADRSYELSTNAWKEVIVHVDGYHNSETGNIGCGVFFRSGSILNFFDGVSKCDAFGNKLEGLWRERGILVAIVKALQTFEGLSAESGSAPKTVIIKTSSSEIEGMLAPIKWFATRIRPPYEDQRVQILENIFPPTVRDVVMYYYHKFVKRQPEFKIKIQHVAAREKSGGALAARLLATAGAEMDEVCMTIGGSELKSGSLWGYHSMIGPPSLDTIPLEKYYGPRSNSIYVSFGIDGNFLILREKASAAMQAADKAGLESFTEVAANKPEVEQKAAISEKHPGIYEYGPYNSFSLASATRIPMGSTKQKPRIRVSEGFQNPKAYNNTAPQRLPDFENGRDPDSGSGVEMDRIGLEARRVLQINFVRYPPYPNKKIPDHQDQEAVPKRRERMADIQEKNIDEFRERGDMRASQLEMWKINPELIKATDVQGRHDVCRMNCECRIAGECACQVVCKCGTEFGLKTKARPESKGARMDEAAGKDRVNKSCIHKFPDKLEALSGSKSTEVNCPHETKAAFECHLMDHKNSRSADSGVHDGELQPGVGSSSRKSRESWGPMHKCANGNSGKEGSRHNTNEKPTDAIHSIYDSNKTAEHKVQLKIHRGRLRRRGIRHPDGSQSEPIDRELPSCPSTTNSAQIPRFPEAQNSPKVNTFSRGQELLKWTPTADCVQVQKYSEGQKYMKGTPRRSTLLQYPITKTGLAEGVPE